MKMLYSFLVVCAYSFLLLLAHGEEKIGILVDAKCGASVSAEQVKAESHPVSCALDSKESGFGIVVEGKFLRFDDFGNKQALLLLRATQKQSNLKVRVGGHFEADLVEVGEIETVD